jgi:hypothetical protein
MMHRGNRCNQNCPEVERAVHDLLPPMRESHGDLPLLDYRATVAADVQPPVGISWKSLDLLAQWSARK